MSSEWRERPETDFCVRESDADYKTEAGRDAVSKGVHIGKVNNR